MVGSAIARLALKSGLEVVLSNSRGPGTLIDLVAELGGRVRAGTPEDAARAGDLVVAAVPLKSFTQLPVDALIGKVVMDTSNYYPSRDGHVADLDAGLVPSSALLQQHLVGSHVVKACNTITPHQLETLASQTPDRGALPIAGDAVGKASVAALLDRLGWDALDIGTLDDSWRIEPDTPAYIIPYLGEFPPAGEDFHTWTTRLQGVAVPALELEVLVAAAVRQSAGDARTPLEKPTAP
jgi:predicted dinucleotide-binding enzyme